MLLHKGANSLQYLHVGPWIPRTHNAAVSQTTDRPCKYDKSGIIVWPKYSNVSLASSWIYCSNKVLKQSNSFFASKGMHAFPFTSEINFPPWYTNLAVSSPLQWFFFFLPEAGNKHRRFCAMLWWGLRPPHPSQRLNLMLGDETGNRCHPWPSVLKHYRPHNQGRSDRGGGVCSPHKLLYQFSSHRFPSHWQLLGNPTLPHLSSKIISITVEHSGLCV